MMKTIATILSSLLTVSVAAAQGTPVTPTTPAAPAAPAAVAFVEFDTTMGNIVLELNPAKAPITVANFLSYVNSGFYNGTIFHRVMPGFVVQGGGFTADMKQKNTQPGITNEWRNGLKNDRGTISMARLGNRPDSATSQFFLNLVDNKMLDANRDGAAYAVFGKVVAGMSVVDAIAKQPTGNVQGMQDVPKTAVSIEKASVITAEQAKAAIEADAAAAAAAAPTATQPAK